MGGADAYIDAFVAQLTVVRGLSENTAKGYAADLADFSRWAEREGVDALAATHKELRAYLAELSRARYATTTINRRLSAIRGLYSWLEQRGVQTGGAAAAVASPKIAHRLPKTMSDAEAARLLESCDVSSVAEASALDVASVDFSSSQVRLFGKGSKERIVPVYEYALDWVARYVAEARPSLASAAKKPTDDAARALFLSTRGRRMSADALRRAFEHAFPLFSHCTSPR